MSDRNVQTEIEQAIKDNPVILFMKGNPNFPQCGFSAQVAGMLNELKVPYAGINVLADPAVREGIKTYSKWPTIPQLYVGGEFIGGCDIATQLFESGELQQKLEQALAE